MRLDPVHLANMDTVVRKPGAFSGSGSGLRCGVWRGRWAATVDKAVRWSFGDDQLLRRKALLSCPEDLIIAGPGGEVRRVFLFMWKAGAARKLTFNTVVLLDELNNCLVWLAQPYSMEKDKVRGTHTDL